MAETDNLKLKVIDKIEFYNIDDFNNNFKKIDEKVVFGVKGAAESVCRKGEVSLSPSDIGLGNVDNTSDINKPVSTAVQNALNNKLDKTAKAADSAKVNGFTVEKAVPADAKFTDTTYSPATQSAQGLMSAKDKKTVDGVSNPNLLINSAFEAWQRGTNFIAPSNAYTSDRWKANGSGAVSQDANGLKITGTVTLQYIMEDADFNKINGKPVTLSYSDSVSGTVAETFTASSALVFNKTMSNRTVYWVKLELGTISTPFVPRLIGDEQALCQRYCRIIPLLPNDVGLGIVGAAMDSNRATFMFSISPDMRIPPSLIKTGMLFVTNDGGYTIKNVDNLTLYFAKDNLIRLDAYYDSYGAVGQTMILTGAPILLNAEIY